MAQSDARFGYQAKMSRENHDLNQPFGFSAAPGMLLPIWYDIASPGDSYYINHDLEFLRTAPLAAPAMVDVLVHYETFFVPMQLLYQPFENTYFSITQNYSSSFDPALFQNSDFPLFDYFYYSSQVIHDFPTGARRSLAFRLADMLDLQATNFIQNTADITLDVNGYLALENYKDFKYHPSFFPASILAYHSIFEHYYRLDDKSQFNSKLANWDQWYSQGSAKQYGSTTDFMTIYQRPWNFDYFTSSYRSPIVSDANLQSVVGPSVYSQLVQPGGGTTPIQLSGASTSVNSQMRGVSTVLPGSYTYSRSMAASSTALIRQAFANEKLAMITGRTRKNYDSQVLAHFGVKVPHDVKHDLTLVGRDTYKLHVGEVTSLASTSGSALGDLAGKGYASGKGHDIKFQAPCHGVLMTIFSIEPMKRYFLGFNRINSISQAFDLPVPEFDRLGNQPVYQYETGSAQLAYSQSMTGIAAWKERYYQYKRRKPRVSLAFMGQAFGTGVGVGGNNDWEPYFISGFAYGQKGNTKNVDSAASERYYIDVECMDALMLVPMRLSWGDGGTAESPDEDWSKHPNLLYSHDPFIVDSFMKVKKVSWMSKDGEPVYPY